MTFAARLLRLIIVILGLTFTVANAAAQTDRIALPSGIGVNVPPLGANANVAFVDAMKEAAPWASSRRLKLDAFGNVMELARGQIAETVIYPSGVYPGGDYTLLYDGNATFALARVCGVVVASTPGRLTIRIVPRPGYGIHLRLMETSANNYARNIRFIAPGAAMRYGVSPFAPSFVAALRGMSVVRFAGWERSDSASGRIWGARTLPGAFTQAGPQGVAPEYSIALANAAQVDPWFVLPVDASDDYIYKFSELVARQLDPRLHPAFEFGHDVWALGSPANAYASLAGRRLGLSPQPQAAALDWYSLRAVQVFAIVDRAFGAGTQRPAHILAGPPAGSGIGGAALDSQILAYANAGLHADAFAVSGDVSSPLSRASGGATPFEAEAAAATAAGLPLIAYEGGSGTLTPSLLAAWHASGGALFIADALSAASPKTAASALAQAAAYGRLTPSPLAITASSAAGMGRAVGVPLAAANRPGATLVAESFANSETSARAWLASGDSCLTAGTATTTTLSIRACNGAAMHDSAGSGALQLTAGGSGRHAFAVYRTPLATSNGLELTYTDYSFDSRAKAGNGITLFLSDAAQMMPTAAGAGSLPAATYVSIALGASDSLVAPPGSGTLVIRGAVSAGNLILGGALDAGGRIARFAPSEARALPRSQRGASVRAIVTPNGGLTVAIDRHDGNGYIAYYRQQIAGRAGQPSVPGSVFVGFVGATGSAPQRQQIGNLRVATVTPATTWYPTSFHNLDGWYDAANVASITKTSTGAVSAWHDSTGYADTLAPPAVSSLPTYNATGLNGLGSISFNGTSLLAGNNPALSKWLFNESTVFIVGSETPANTLGGDLLFSGAYDVQSPVWALRTTSWKNTSMYALNTEVGDLQPQKVESGATIWTAAGSVSNASRLFRRNGTLIASGAGPAIVASGSYPLSVGAEYSGGKTFSYNYRGDIGEIVLYNRFLTPAEVDEVEGYLACKWGLQGRLAANHPYRNTCPSGNPQPVPTPTATPAPVGTPLPDPIQLKSSGGRLTVNVVATTDPSTQYPSLTYNGVATPPTLRLLPGDTLFVNLTNKLPVPAAGSTYANDVNLHYHGLHVSPNAPADDSIDMVAAPGKSVRYTVPIPTNHPPGLYWYHSHAHAESERQNLAGLSGALIIEGIGKYTPAVATLPERILIVRDRQPAGTPLPPGDLSQIEAMRWSMQRAGGNAMSAMSMGMNEASEMRGATNAETRNPYVDPDPFYRTFVRTDVADTHCKGAETATKVWTVNGVSQPSIGLKPGERQFWRLVNAGSDTYLDVQLDNANMQIVALDGVPLISGMDTPASMTVGHYVVPPASRIEFIVTGPAAGKQAYLRTNCFDAGPTGSAMPAAILASIDPSASAPATSRNTQRVSARVRPFRFHTASYIKAHAASVEQTVYFSEQMQINGQSYNPSAPPMFYAQVGTTQEWTIVNTSTQVHTFHMHQVHFVVEAIDGIAQAQKFVMDNVNVPAATTSGPGTVKVLLDFTDSAIVGTFLVHCHILSHEDMGMMAKIRVGTAPPLSVSASTLAFASPTAAKQSLTVSGGKPPYSPSGCTGVAKAAVTGSTVTVTPAGAGSCLLTIEDSTGLIASVSTVVSAAKSPVTLSAASASFTSAGAAAQKIGIAGGTLPYTAAGCAGTATGAITGSSLLVTPKAVGTCTIVVSDAKNETASLSVTVNATATGSATDSLTFHYDALRTGWNQHETALTTTSITNGQFAKLANLTGTAGALAFGRVYAQPLYVTKEATSDGKTHNLVIVATATDQVYAYDDQTLAMVWHRSFLNPPSVVPQSWNDTRCSTPSPDVGITGTPVIDRGLDRLYAVVATKENGTFHLRIHAISLKNGLEAVNGTGSQIGPTDVTGTVSMATGGTASVDPLWNLQRPALLESAGNIYVALGSKCDMHNNFVHGWMLAYNASSLKMSGNMFDISNENDGSGTYLSSIWMSGYGPAADPQGNVYFATGNGPNDGGVNAFGMSVVKVAGTLSTSGGNVSSFAPYHEANDSKADGDLGSGGVMLLPDQKGTYPHMVVAGGKCGAGANNGGTIGCVKYILNRDKLGGRQENEAGTLWHGSTAGWMFGGPAYFADAQGVSHVVYGGGGGNGDWDPLNTYNLNVSPVSLAVQSSQNAVGCLICSQGDPGGALPVVSSNGTQSGSAIVWAIKTPPQSGGVMTLYAFNAMQMNTTLFSGVAGPWGIASGATIIAGPFTSPLVANGKVYVPIDGGVGVFGLKSESAAIGTARSTKAVAADNASIAVVPSTDAASHVIYGTITQLQGDTLTVALRTGRTQRVDAAAAIASGTYSAPLFVGKPVAIVGDYVADGTLRADVISKIGRADGSAPVDR